jgi:hypothetical protein
MGDQATMNGQAKQERFAAGRIGRNVAGFAHDLVTLCELQIQLLGVDLRDARARGVVPGLLVGIAVLIAIASVPVLLTGAGLLLANATGVSNGSALIVVATTAIAASGIVGWIAWRKLTAALNLLARSQNEFRENLQSIKSALKQSGHSADRSEAQSDR